jgi:hypothetical protein
MSCQARKLENNFFNSELMNGFYKLAIAICFYVSLVKTVSAVVNIESLMKDTDFDEGWSFVGAIQLSGASGNTKNSRTDLSSLLNHRDGSVKNLFSLNLKRGESQGVKNADRMTVHLRHMRDLGESAGYEAYTQLQQNDFTNLEERLLVGGGRYLNLANYAKSNFKIGFGALYETERYKNTTSESSVRSNLYSTYRHIFSNRSSFSATIYVQNKVDDLSDQRALGDLVMSFPLNESISMNFSLDLEYDSKPLVGVKSTDWAYQSGIKFDF